MGGPTAPTPSWTPTNTGTADSTYASGLAGLSGNASTGNTLASNVVNSPYAAAAQSGASTAGSYLTGSLAPQLTGASSSLAGASSPLLSSAAQTLNTAYDPQNALYNQTLQQTNDQTLAGLAATGVASTPYGAGVLGQTDANFNINWQNNQLARQTQGLTDYDSALSAYAGANTSAGNLGASGASATTTGSALPYSTATGMDTTGLGALTSASGLDTSTTGASGNYLSLADQNYQDQLQSYQTQLQQYDSIFSGLGSLLGMGTGTANSTVGGSLLSKIPGF